MDGTNRPRTLDNTTQASNPGGLRLSHEKLQKLRPELYERNRFLHYLRELVQSTSQQKLHIEEHVRFGDSRAAVVVSISPLLVAAYTDELDCIAMLCFPDECVDDYTLSIGSRLLTVNTYKRGTKYDQDLILGPRRIPRWVGFHPIIGDFVSDDRARLEECKRAIAEEEWQRALQFGQEYLRLRPGMMRDGRPIYASTPANAR